MVDAVPVLADNVIFSTDEDLRGNTAKLVAREVRVTDFAQTRAAHYSVERRLRRLEGRDLTTWLPSCIQFGFSGRRPTPGCGAHQEEGIEYCSQQQSLVHKRRGRPPARQNVQQHRSREPQEAKRQRERPWPRQVACSSRQRQRIRVPLKAQTQQV